MPLWCLPRKDSRLGVVYFGYVVCLRTIEEQASRRAVARFVSVREVKLAAVGEGQVELAGCR
jgi:hypothetical protein